VSQQVSCRASRLSATLAGTPAAAGEVPGKSNAASPTDRGATQPAYVSTAPANPSAGLPHTPPCHRMACCNERYGFVLEHVEAQTTSCLFTAEGLPAVDFIGRSERLDEDFGVRHGQQT
jgi:hypothetical protein